MEERKDHQQNNQIDNSQSKERDHQATTGKPAATDNRSAGITTTTTERSSDTSTKQGVTGSDYDGQVTP